ncbi:MAG TPA: right-handed parallel beta-helix repeat-containing protein [Gemmatimonadales bacterium]|nr:right-handed parallel beta-helix repeat-containing protein [Gemmatimonadales bacterium]
MTFTYKLSRRLALGHLGLTAFAAGVIAACSGGEPTAPTTSGTTDLLAAVKIAPKKATIETNQTIRFSGTGISTAGDSMATSIEWTATGGSITADGVLSAHATGTLRVIGKALGHNKSDTSTVVVVPPQPTLTSIVVSPDPATVTEGKTASFSASGKLSDGSTAPIGVVWSATGGTIDAGGNYSAGMTPGAFRVVATNTSSTVADTVPVTVTAAQLAQIVLAPATVTLVPGGTQQFIGYGRTSTGDSISTPVSFTATGGTVSAGGLYTAGQTTGTFRVIATSTTTNLADTSAVTIQPAALAQLILLPALATVATGGTVQFQVYGRTTAGDSFAAQATYSATGGTIGSAGLYTAGSTAGTFRVIAAQVGGTLADTSAVTITAPLAGSCTGVNIAAGASIQGAVNNNPTGTTFCLGTGTFVQQSVVPKSGDVFVGQGMGVTILDGQNAAGRAFSIGVAPYANNVTIKNLTVTRYVWPYGPDGMISAANSADPLTQYSTGWVIDSVEASYSGASALGIRVGYGTTVRNCHIHHNWLLGMGGTGDGVLIENNEIAFNNYQNNSDPSDEAGGFKFVRTNNLVVRNNYSHDNHGIGMWTDG